MSYGYCKVRHDKKESHCGYNVINTIGKNMNNSNQQHLHLIIIRIHDSFM